MKTCTRCGESKPEGEFRANPKCLDGLDSWCKKCHNKSKQDWLKAHPEAARAKERAKYARRMQKLRGEGYVVGDPANRPRKGKSKTITLEEKRIRHNARRVTRRAVANGKLVKQLCFTCGEQETEIHHPDYSRPLDVVWLCKAHHREVHS